METAGAVHNVTVGQQEAVWRKDEPGPVPLLLRGTATALERHHRGPYQLHRVHDGLGIGVEKIGIVKIQCIHDRYDDERLALDSDWSG